MTINSRLFSFFVFLLLIYIILCRPAVRKHTIGDHEWFVPNEEGWEKVIHEANRIQETHLSRCKTIRECQKIIDDLINVFLRHPVSRKFLEEPHEESQDTIFKWGWTIRLIYKFNKTSFYKNGIKIIFFSIIQDKKYGFFFWVQSLFWTVQRHTTTTILFI